MKNSLYLLLATTCVGAVSAADSASYPAQNNYPAQNQFVQQRPLTAEEVQREQLATLQRIEALLKENMNSSMDWGYWTALTVRQFFFFLSIVVLGIGVGVYFNK